MDESVTTVDISDTNEDFAEEGSRFKSNLLFIFVFRSLCWGILKVVGDPFWFCLKL